MIYESERTRRRRAVFAVFWVVAILGLIIAAHAILIPFILAVVIAYVLSPIVRSLTGVRIGARHPPRWAAVLALYACIIGVLVVTVQQAVPRIAIEVRDFLRDEVPHLREEVGSHWIPRIRSIRERFVTPVARATVPPETPSSGEDNQIVLAPRTGGGYDIVLPNDGIQVEHRGDRDFRVTTARPAPEVRHDNVDLWIDRLRELGEGHTDLLLRWGSGLVGGIIAGIFGFFITLMLSAYLLLTNERIFAFLTSLVPPPSRDSFEQLVHRVDRGLAGVVRGQLVICGVNGVLSAVGFGLARLPYWPLLAVMAAIFSIIPIFGSILSSVPAVAVGLRFGLPTAFFVLIWIIGIHQLEANVLNPKILGDAAKINPVLVVFSLLAGEHFFGILGALLAVPTMSVVQSVFLHWRREVLNYGDRALPGDTLMPPPPEPSGTGTPDE